jgi:hypothetical protein
MEQVINIRCTLRVMGVPINGPSHMFGDKQSAISGRTATEQVIDIRCTVMVCQSMVLPTCLVTNKVPSQVQ